MTQLTINVEDLYLRQKPFSFNAIKAGDIAVFNCGKCAVIEAKVKPDNKGQAWYGLTLFGYTYAYDSCGEFDASGECNNTSAMNIAYIIKTSKSNRSKMRSKK